MALNIEEMKLRVGEESVKEDKDWVLLQARITPEVMRILDHARIDAGLSRAKFIERLIRQYLTEAGN